MILGTGERLRAYVSSRFPSYFDLPVVLFGYLAIALKIVVRRLPCSRKFRHQEKVCVIISINFRQIFEIIAIIELSQII